MELVSLANVVPPARYSQVDCWRIAEQSKALGRLRERSAGLMRKVMLGNSGIDYRHFAMPQIERIFDHDAQALATVFEEEAPKLATRALSDALEQASLGYGELDALFTCTCTGYLCPGISSHVAERLGLRRNAFLQDLVGLGCGAAIPSLRAASGLLAAQPGARVAVVAVEVCSAAFYMDDDPGVIISLCLFGDGASASIWQGSARTRQHPATGLFLDGFGTRHHPEIRSLLRFENREGKLRNRLHKSVPERAAPIIEDLFREHSQAANGSTAAICSHAGGRDVIEALEPVLAGHSLDTARQVLRAHGNMSSPSVLFALERHLRDNGLPEPGKGLWLTSFGAGFAAHGAFLQRQDGDPEHVSHG